MTLFKEVTTVGELKDLLANLPDDTQLFQSNRVSGRYNKSVNVLSLEKDHASFDSFHSYIKTHRCREDKIKGTFNNLENIVIFGS